MLMIENLMTMPMKKKEKDYENEKGTENEKEDEESNETKWPH